MAGFFVNKDKKAIVNVDYMEAYIPIRLFKKGLNEVLGDRLNIFGIFNFKIGDKNGNIKGDRVYTYKFPTMMITQPNSIENREFELIKGTGVQKYKVLKYFKGDQLLCNTDVVASIDNVEKFVNLLIDGNLPNTMKYTDVLKAFLDNTMINKQNLGVSSLIFEVVISEIYRYKGDMSSPLRKYIGKGKCGEYDYEAANARTICANNGTFAALTFEDPNTMLITSMNKLRYGRKENPSPIEKIIRV